MLYNTDMLGLYYKSRRKSSLFLGIFLILSAFFSPLAARAETPSDPQYAFQAPIYNKIGAPEAWDHATGSHDVVVAVIDTGVDIWHEDLKDNIWINAGEIAGNGIDDDGNGFTDDTNGWNFVDNNNDVGLAVISKDDDPEAVTHGTVLAGLIGAAANNGFDGAGLNWNVRIMSVVAIKRNGNGSLLNVAKAVDYAAANGADIITLSFVGDVNDARLEQSLRSAYSKGIVIVAAAGNNVVNGRNDLDQIKRYPICGDQGDPENWILGVTSVDLSDHLSSFADYGSCVDIAAPAEDIYSTQRYVPQYGYAKTFGGGWYGTSFSVPLVAGAAALVKSVRPDWDAKAIISDLLSTADDIDGANAGFVGRIGYGRLDVAKAVEKAIASKQKPAVKEQKNAKKNISVFTEYDAAGNAMAAVSAPTPLKWSVYGGGIILARLTKGKLTLESLDWTGRRHVLWSAAGIAKLSSMKVGNYWTTGEQVLMMATQNGQAVKFTFDIGSLSWRRDVQ